MDRLAWLSASVGESWPVWLVSGFLIVGAVMDGARFRVPNWLTFSMILSGCACSAVQDGWPGLGWSLGGIAVGLACLLPFYAIGGMGAGDVKLFAGVGAWVHASHAFYAFGAAAVAGGIFAVAMILYRGSWRKHLDQLHMVLFELMVIRDPTKLSEIAAARKSSMLLLPYAIPIAIGTIVYFAWEGMLL